MFGYQLIVTLTEFWKNLHGVCGTLYWKWLVKLSKSLTENETDPIYGLTEYEQSHDKTNKMTAPNEDSDQPRHPPSLIRMPRLIWDQPGHPPNLIRVFAVRSMGRSGPKVSSCREQRFWSDWADAQADLSLRWAHAHFVGFVMSRLILLLFRCHSLS